LVMIFGELLNIPPRLKLEDGEPPSAPAATVVARRRRLRDHHVDHWRAAHQVWHAQQAKERHRPVCPHADLPDRVPVCQSRAVLARSPDGDAGACDDACGLVEQEEAHPLRRRLLLGQSALRGVAIGAVVVGSREERVRPREKRKRKPTRRNLEQARGDVEDEQWRRAGSGSRTRSSDVGKLEANVRIFERTISRCLLSQQANSGAFACRRGTMNGRSKQRRHHLRDNATPRKHGHGCPQTRHAHAASKARPHTQVTA